VNRPELIILLGGAALLHAATAGAQEPGRVYRLGMLSYLPRESANTVALFDKLRRSGFVEGQNLRVEGRFSTAWARASSRMAAAVEGEEVGFASDSPLEGTGFEPSVLRQEKWSMPSSSDQTRVGRTLTLVRC
jgi:hypothetical protein